MGNNPDGNYWYVPFVFTGLAETLPIQQFYLMKHFGTSDGEDIYMRRAVKASHTGTGVGSMTAFIAASQIFSSFGIHGTSWLGLTFLSLKIMADILIHALFWIKE